MNGSKGEEKLILGLSASESLRPVYLGVILFIIGLLLKNQTPVPDMIMIIGAFIAIISLISLFSVKK